jgi:hypothetical protein
MLHFWNIGANKVAENQGINLVEQHNIWSMADMDRLDFEMAANIGIDLERAFFLTTISLLAGRVFTFYVAQKEKRHYLVILENSQLFQLYYVISYVILKISLHDGCPH